MQILKKNVNRYFLRKKIRKSHGVSYSSCIMLIRVISENKVFREDFSILTNIQI